MLLLLPLLVISGWCNFATSAVVDFSPIIRTKTGSLKGKLVQLKATSVYQFSGIPFAEPPIGDRRFRKPVPIKTWNRSRIPTVLEAINFPSPCTQVAGGPTFEHFLQAPLFGSEDCLYLNIWVPRVALESSVNGTLPSEQKLAVYFFIHGGGFFGGSASWYIASTLADLNNIIVVETQYRLGSLGFAYLGTQEVPGNMAMWDQLEALKWVNENIDSFGGNNGAITIGGQSAGAASVTFHLLSPYSRKYFQRAIVESGSAIAPWAAHTPQQAKAVTDIVLEQVAIKLCNQSAGMTISKNSSTSDKTRCLKGAPATVFPRADAVAALAGYAIPFSPVIDGDFLPRDPKIMLQSGDFYRAPLLIGANENEGSSYLGMAPTAFERLPTPGNPTKPMPKNLTIADYRLIIDDLFKVYLSGLWPTGPILSKMGELHYWPQAPPGYPLSDAIVKALSSMTGDVSLFCPTYAFAEGVAAYYPNENVMAEWMGVFHSAELPFVFGNPFTADAEESFNNDDASLSLVVMAYWTNFIKYGNPNGLTGATATRSGIYLRRWPTLVGDDCSARFFEITVPKQVQGIGDAVLPCGFKARDCEFWQSFIPKFLGLFPKQTQGSMQPSPRRTLS